MLATIPAVIVGFVLEKRLAMIFGSPAIAAFFLIANGALLYFGDKIAGKSVGLLEQFNWKGALAVGIAQCFALIPGFSRSGLTIVAGTIAGLTHEDSARFSFLLATPIILGATVLEAPKLLNPTPRSAARRSSRASSRASSPMRASSSSCAISTHTSSTR